MWVARNPPGFAFIEFDDARDAAVGPLRDRPQKWRSTYSQDAVEEMNGKDLCGARVRVEISRGGNKGLAPRCLRRQLIRAPQAPAVPSAAPVPALDPLVVPAARAAPAARVVARRPPAAGQCAA